MHLHHSVVEAEVLLTRVASGEIETGWDAAGGWDQRRQQLLVDSVLRDWPIPPVLVASDDEQDVLLDGRERLRALWRFTHDELPVAGPAQAAGEYLEQLDGLFYSQLPERFRRRVRRYGVPVLRLPSRDDGEVRELLSRWDATTPPVRAATAPAPPAAPAVPTMPPAAPAAPAVPTMPPPPAVPPPPSPDAPSTDSPPPAPSPVPSSSPATTRFPAVREPGESFRPAEPSTPERSAGAHHRAAADSEPIFDELSAWFLDTSASAGPDGEPGSAWSSPADAQHEEARTALRQSTVELTPSGLPIRRPSAHLAPGAIPAPARAGPSRAPDPRTVGEHLSRFREGASAARDDLLPPA